MGDAGLRRFRIDPLGLLRFGPSPREVGEVAIEVREVDVNPWLGRPERTGLLESGAGRGEAGRAVGLRAMPGARDGRPTLVRSRASAPVEHVSSTASAPRVRIDSLREMGRLSRPG